MPKDWFMFRSLCIGCLRIPTSQCLLNHQVSLYSIDQPQQKSARHVLKTHLSICTYFFNAMHDRYQPSNIYPYQDQLSLTITFIACQIGHGYVSLNHLSINLILDRKVSLTNNVKFNRYLHRLCLFLLTISFARLSSNPIQSNHLHSLQYILHYIPLHRYLGQIWSS